MNEIICPLSISSARFPQSTAVIFGARSITYSQLDAYVCSTVKYLKKIGIKPGERAAIVSNNCIEFVIVLLALWRFGAIACPLTTRAPGRTLAEMVRMIDAQVLLSDSHKVLSNPQIVLRKFYLEEMINFDIREGGTREAASVSLEREATHIFTSGSSGDPKLAVHSYGNHYWNAMGANENIPLSAGDRWLLSLPLYHVGGLAIIFRVILSGAALVIANLQEDLYLILKRFKITHVSLVSTQLFRLLKDFSPETDLGFLKAVLLGGSAIPRALLESAVQRGLPVFLSYGLTEMASQVAATARFPLTSLKESRVVPLNFRELKIAADGEILVRGKTLFKGYRKSSGIFLPLTADGWFQTGDLGTLSDEGNLLVTGRKDNMFISGGENIQPEEIERCLYSFPEIEYSVVVPVEDSEFGFRPAAFVKERKGFLLSEVNILTQLEKWLPRFKLPAAIYEWPSEFGDCDQKEARKDLRQRLADGTVKKIS